MNERYARRVALLRLTQRLNRRRGWPPIYKGRWQGLDRYEGSVRILRYRYDWDERAIGRLMEKENQRYLARPPEVRMRVNYRRYKKDMHTPVYRVSKLFQARQDRLKFALALREEEDSRDQLRYQV